MEAEYVALSSSMRELVPLRELVTEIALTLKCKDCLLVCTHSTVFEDNNGALTLANLPCLTPRSKHINIRMHWFCEHVQNGSIHIVKVSTHAQVADIFTKGLTCLPFENVRIFFSWAGDYLYMVSSFNFLCLLTSFLPFTLVVCLGGRVGWYIKVPVRI